QLTCGFEVPRVGRSTPENEGSSGKELRLGGKLQGFKPFLSADRLQTGEIYLRCNVLIPGVNQHIRYESMLAVGPERPLSSFGRKQLLNLQAIIESQQPTQVKALRGIAPPLDGSSGDFDGKTIRQGGRELGDIKAIVRGRP